MLRSRIAPTPSGYLHIGNAVNFAISWLWTRASNGTLRLRIDDNDAIRTKPEFLDDIFETLHWMGIDWDEGPQTTAEHQKLYSQNLRAETYNAFIEKLIETGNVFACNCPRKDIKGQYPGTCRNKGLPLTAPDVSLRIFTPEDCSIIIKDFHRRDIKVNLYSVMRDFVIRRRDGIAAYQVASLCDDLDFKTSLIVRGEDLLYSTAAQIYLADLSGNESFKKTTFYHHPLLNDEAGNKLSKSAGSTSIRAWRTEGKTSLDFYRLLSRLLNWDTEFETADEMLKAVKQGYSLTSFLTTL